MSYGPIRERLRRGEVLILDGAIGTEILRRDLTWADHQVLSRPTVVRAIHEDYVKAGADDLAPTPAQARPEYRETIGALAKAGCDLVLIETVNSIAEAQVAVEAANEIGLPCWVSFVPDEHGNLFSGESMAEASRTLASLGPDALLVNCAPPEDARAGLRELAAARSGPIGIYPHIGRFDPPEWRFTDEYPPARYVEEARGWLGLGAQILGGCCGTTPAHIAALCRDLWSGVPGPRSELSTPSDSGPRTPDCS